MSKSSDSVAAFVREPGCVCTDPSLVARAGHERRCPLYRERERDVLGALAAMVGKPLGRLAP